MDVFQIDTRTLDLLLCLGNAVTIGLLLFCAHYLPGDRFHVAFIGGKLLQAVSWGLLLLDGRVPRLVSFQIGMTTMAAGIALDAIALASVRARISRRTALWTGIPALLSALNLWLPVIGARRADLIGSVLFTFPYAVASYLLLVRGRQRSRLATAVGSILLCCYLAAVAPGVYATLPVSMQVVPPTNVLLSSLLLFFLVMMVSSVGYTLLKKENADRERERVIVELQDAIQKVRTLKGLLPICSGCKKIRNDEGYWQHVEVYVHNHADVEFSHGLCPDCVARLYPDFADRSAG